MDALVRVRMGVTERSAQQPADYAPQRTRDAGGNRSAHFTISWRRRRLGIGILPWRRHLDLAAAFPLERRFPLPLPSKLGFARSLFLLLLLQKLLVLGHQRLLTLDLVPLIDSSPGGYRKDDDCGHSDTDLQARAALR